jgi:hypothetical protein
MANRFTKYRPAWLGGPTQADRFNTRVMDILERYDAEKRVAAIPLGMRDGTGKSINSIDKVYKKLKQALLTAMGMESRNGFMAPDWDFQEVNEAAQTETMARRAFEKYVEQIWKQGFNFVGKNKQTVQYIKKRFAQIALVTDKPTEILMHEVSYSLVSKASTVLIKKRKDVSSGGKVRTTFDGKRLQPIAGLFVADPTMILVDRDEYGNIRKWKQENIADMWTMQWHTRKQEWMPKDVMHIRDRTATSTLFFWPMPMLTPVMPDIRALREMEELSMVQAMKFAIPRYHGKVGEKERPGTNKEIAQLAVDLANMGDDTALITSSRAAIENISNGDQILDLSPYLAYWTKRIRSGLGMSDVGMGEGNTANRATAQTLVSEMQNTTIKFQNIIKIYMEELIKELLYEAGFSEHTLSEDDMVFFQFPEIDLQNKIAKDTHALNLFQGNGITFSEMRTDIGKEQLEPGEYKELYANMFPKEDPASAEATTKNKNNPENQHGKSTSKPKVAKD